MAWQAIAVSVGLSLFRAGLNYFLSQREAPVDIKVTALSDLNVPRLTESAPIPVVFGTVRIDGPNVVWFGQYEPRPAEPGAPATAVRYTMGMHLAFCHGPVDSVEEIFVGNHKLESIGPVDLTSGPVDLVIDAPGLFGGYNGEGGIVAGTAHKDLLAGGVTILPGLPDQEPHPYLKYWNEYGRVDGVPWQPLPDPKPTPAYRGMLSVVLGSVKEGPVQPIPYPIYYGTVATPKPWALTVRRVQVRSFGEPQWYPERAEIGPRDMNPIHILHECLTDESWGLGLAPAQLDDLSFQAAADALYNENFGMSLLWTQETSLRAFMSTVLDHIDGLLFVHPATGQVAVRLARPDYDPQAVPAYGPDEIAAVTAFSRASSFERLNAINVLWFDRELGRERTAPAHDTAQISLRGSVATTIQYPYVSDPAIANRLAQRDLRQLGLPLAHVELRVNAEANQLLPGDVFRWTWPDYGVSQMLLRVVNADYGTLMDGVVTLQCVEDVFRWEDTVFDDPAPTEWEDPVPDAQPPAELLALEEPWWLLMQRRRRSAPDGYDVYQPSDLTTGRALLAAGPAPAGHYPTWELWSAAGGGELERAGEGQLATVLYLAHDLEQGDEFFEWSNDAEIAPGLLPLIALGDEIVLGYWSPEPRILYVYRGMLDTTPQLEPHVEGTPAVVLGYLTPDQAEWVQPAVAADRERGQGTVIELRPRTRTARDLLELDDAPATSLALDARALRPYPPGRVEIVETSTATHVFWAHRNRLSRTNRGVQWQNDGDVGPEPGVGYVVRVYGVDGDGVEQRFVDTMTAGTFLEVRHDDEKIDLGRSDLSPWLRVELWSVRDAEKVDDEIVGTWSYQAQERLITDRTVADIDHEFDPVDLVSSVRMTDPEVTP